MPVDIHCENLVRLTQAAKHVPGHPHVATLWRWVQRSTNPLECGKVGGRIFTSLEAIDRFISRCNSERETPPSVNAARRHEQAERELDAAGC